MNEKMGRQQAVFSSIQHCAQRVPGIEEHVWDKAEASKAELGSMEEKQKAEIGKQKYGVRTGVRL